MNHKQMWQELHDHLRSVNSLLESDPALTSVGYASAVRDILANMNSAEAKQQQQDSPKRTLVMHHDNSMNELKERVDDLEEWVKEIDNSMHRMAIQNSKPTPESSDG